MPPEGEGGDTTADAGGKRPVLAKLGKAIMFFLVFAVAIPVAIGYLYGIPAGAILSLGILMPAGGILMPSSWWS